MQNLVDQAARIAIAAHAEQRRKSDDFPYIVHPFMVAMQVRQYGFSDKAVAAALLHDVLEDTKVTKEELTAQVGEEVVALVQAVSEDKAKPWEDRKAEYIANICAASDEVKAISVADKLYNFNDMLQGIEKEGEAFWSHFTRGKAKQRWFFETYVQDLSTVWAHPLLDELKLAVAKFPKD